MKKIIGIALAVLLVLAVTGCSKKDSGASGDRAASGPVKWRMTSIYVDVPEGEDPTYKSLGASMHKFIDDVNSRSNGRIEITGYYNSVLGSANDTFQQMERGETQIYFGQPMSAIDSRFGAWGLPYLFQSYDEINDIACNPDSEFFKVSAQWISEHNAVLLAMGLTNQRGLFNAKHRVAKVTDARDLKLRTYEDPVVNTFWGDICQAIPMPVGEVYTALQTRSVDGLEFSANSVLGRKYQEVGKFYSNINWQWTNGASFVINADEYNKLPADLQKLVTDCAREAAVFQGQREMADEQLCFGTLRDAGVEVYMITDDDLQSWVDYAKSISPRLRNAVGAEAYDQIVGMVESERAKR